MEVADVKKLDSVLIFDCMNEYLRHFMINESSNSEGTPVGGILGFVKSLSAIVEILRPSRVILVWEQGGGSQRRKSIYKDYKANRGKLSGGDGTDQKSDKQNNIWQLLVLSNVLKTLPICSIFIPNTECDDIIAYLVKFKLKEAYNTKFVVSCDKDFYQLLEDPTVRIYNPRERKLYSSKTVQEEYSISARNFVLARTLIGDESDNISGVGGVGFKTAVKLFPDLSNENVDYDVGWLLEQARTLLQSSKKPPKVLNNIVNNYEILKRNWKLMFLGHGTLSYDQISKINTKIDEYKPKADYMEYYKVLLKENISVDNTMDKAPGNLKYLLAF